MDSPLSFNSVKNKLPVPPDVSFTLQHEVGRKEEMKKEIRLNEQGNHLNYNNRLDNTSSNVIARCYWEEYFSFQKETARKKSSNMTQLQLWVYENSNITFAEKMEKQKWEQKDPTLLRSVSNRLF